MKYDKLSIINTAKNIKLKSSDLSSLQVRLGRLMPIKCSSYFYTKRFLLMRRISDLQTELISLSHDIEQAANQMGYDDIQNASYIRCALKNRSNQATFNYNSFRQGPSQITGNEKIGMSGFSSNSYFNQIPIKLIGNSERVELEEVDPPWYKKIGNWFVNLKKFDESDRKFAQEHPFQYLWQSGKKIVLGDYTDDNLTELSFAGNIALSIFDLDLPCDVRDLVHDIHHWGEGDNFVLYFVLDLVALAPIVGGIKYLKYADDVGDVTKTAGKAAKTIDNMSDAAKNIDNASDYARGAKSLGETTETAAEVGKNTDRAVDVVDDTTDLGKAAETATDVKGSLKPIDEKIRIANGNSSVLQWVGDPGNSKRIPISSSSDLAVELKKYGIDGLHYVDGDIDFSPVSHFDYHFESFDELYHSIGDDIPVGRLMSTDGVKGRDALNAVVREKWQSIAKGQIVKKISEDPNFAIELQRKTGINVSSVKNQSDLERELSRVGLTLHETPDCKQIQFIPTIFHENYKHSGGTAEMLERLISGDMH